METTEMGATTLADDVVDDNVGKHYHALLTLRVIMHGREAGSIIGKRGENVKKFREETGARINISDATSPERIVTVTGSLDQIVSTFRMVCCRFEEDLQQLNAALGGSEMSKHLVGLRLILPAIQCGSVIGRNGTKVKEIRDNSGASVQISGELLPNSTERLVTVSGSVDAVIKAVEMICGVILECPIKGPVSQYRPKPTRPVSLVLPVQYDAPHQSGHFQLPAMSYPQVFPYPTLIASQQTIVALPYSALPPGTILQPLASSCSFPVVNGAPVMTSNAGQSSQPTQILTIPNELIGCVIGRGGAKINEIRQQSGANIKISSSDDRTSDRMITITGTQEAVMTAIQLIEHSLEIHKATMFGSGIRYSRSSSSLVHSTTSSFHQNSVQPQQSGSLDGKSVDTKEAKMTSSPSPTTSKMESTVNSKQPNQLPKLSQGEFSTPIASQRPQATTLLQSGQGLPLSFHQPSHVGSHQSTPHYLLPISQVQPFFQTVLTQKDLRNNMDGVGLTEGMQGDEYQAYQGSNLMASTPHSGQHVFNPNLYHVQTSTAIQIAFRPLNPLLPGSIMDSQLMESSSGNLMVLGAPNGSVASPDGSSCLQLDPSRVLGLKSKSTSGCGGYVLTTGSRSGFKFAPY